MLEYPMKPTQTKITPLWKTQPWILEAPIFGIDENTKLPDKAFENTNNSSTNSINKHRSFNQSGYITWNIFFKNFNINTGI